MKISKLVLLLFFINSFGNKIEKLEDLNTVEQAKWDEQVTRNEEVKKKLVEWFEKASMKEYLDKTTGRTEFFLQGVAYLDQKVGDSYNKMISQATELESKELKSRINRALALFFLKPLAKGAIAVGIAYCSYQGIKFALAELVKPYFDRWGKHREFLAKLSPKKVTSLEPRIGYELEQRHLERIINVLKEQIETGKRIAMDGCLLFGAPGNGKTEEVNKIAYKTQLPLIVVNANDLINSKSGTVEENLKLLFSELKRKAPCICFFDELDLIVNHKPEIMGQLLQEIDSLQAKKGVFLIAATNHKNSIRESLLRPGRFGAHIEFKNPTNQEIRLLLDLYLQKNKIALDDEINYDLFVASLEGFSCAGIKAYCEFLALLCKENNTKIVIEDFLREGHALYKVA